VLSRFKDQNEMHKMGVGVSTSSIQIVKKVQQPPSRELDLTEAPGSCHFGQQVVLVGDQLDHRLMEMNITSNNIP